MRLPSWRAPKSLMEAHKMCEWLSWQVLYSSATADSTPCKYSRNTYSTCRGISNIAASSYAYTRSMTVACSLMTYTQDPSRIPNEMQVQIQCTVHVLEYLYEVVSPVNRTCVEFVLHLRSNIQGDYFWYLRLNLSVDTAVFLWTQPINFDRVFSSTSEHGFSFGYPPFDLCAPVFECDLRESQQNQYCTLKVLY